MAPKQHGLARRGHLVPLASLVRPQQCAAYGRVSSDKQHEDQTITTQQTLLLVDITSRDRPDLPESEQRKLVAQFWDDPVSGTVPLEKRSEGSKLISLICNRGDIRCSGDCHAAAVIDVVWITKLDRLARQLQILIEIEAFFRCHGVALRCLEFNIDTGDRNGKLMFHILGVIAEWERETILERTSQGRRQKASEGKFVGGRRTFGLTTDEHGYLIIDTTLIEGVNKMACDIVKEIFENVALHGSTAFREAQRFGLTERKVGGILHNPRYKGEGGMLADGEWLPATRNNPPQIVSPEIWSLAQKALIDNRTNASRNRHYEYLLSQVMICCEPKGDSLCGRKFVGRLERRRSSKGETRHETKYVYYYCQRQGCTARPMRGQDIETAVWNVVADAQRHPEKFLAETLQRRDNTRLIHDVRTEITGIVDHLSRLETERRNVLRSWEKGQRTEQDADVRLNELADQVGPLREHRNALELQLRSLTVSATDLQRAGVLSADIAEQIEHIEQLCQSDDPDAVRRGRERKKALIRATVERAEVRTGADRESRIQLYLRFGRALPLEVPNNWGDKRLNLSTEPRISQQGSENPQQESFVIVHELVIPRPPMGGPKGQTKKQPKGWKVKGWKAAVA